MTNFGKILRKLRKTNKIKIKDLANAIKLTPQAINYYESGKREPSLENLIAIADYFNVSLDYLVGRDCEAVIKSAISEENKETADFFRHLYSIVNELDEKSREELLQYANYLKIKNIIKE